MEKVTEPEESMTTENRQNSVPSMDRIISHLQEHCPDLGNVRHLYEAVVAKYDGVHATFEDGRSSLVLTTYDYLGLLGDERLNDAAKEAVDFFGTGCFGSRVLGGSLDLHRQLEQELAAWVGREDAMVLSSGFMTNYTVLAAMAGSGTWVLADELNHISIDDGCQAAKNAGATVHVYRHNDMGHVEELLRQAPRDAPKIVVSDGIFGMEGDLLDLPGLSELCRRHGALLFVDEAHSLGVIGPNGGGVQDYYGLPHTVDLVMGTLSKAIPASGGFIAGSQELIAALRLAARGYLFSGASSPMAAAASLAALRVIQQEGADRRSLLQRNTKHLRRRLEAAGLHPEDVPGPITPLVLGEDHTALEAARLCHERGVFVLSMVPPAVAPGTSGLRLNPTAAHSPQNIDFACDVIIEAVRAATERAED
ncbi:MULTISPECIES: aminotransferase class I/II-fold pyridoxal phosphate-dependent enzyme [unclassified Streptomyces]|uniref:aminotransferase class I/II-fold pyridoxal phosphate-dependent enzyme n=1 Tax=unclassified Streptomyces TaxID=2593676 RepID=UPI002E2DD4E3|nr:aminotransferase class I/II-fold pyridoxal phosphate-dependent enzyme [Streptomyces sp. NBC_00273]